MRLLTDSNSAIPAIRLPTCQGQQDVGGFNRLPAARPWFALNGWCIEWSQDMAASQDIARRAYSMNALNLVG
jgi:hypothetical protein